MLGIYYGHDICTFLCGGYARVSATMRIENAKICMLCISHRVLRVRYVAVLGSNVEPDTVCEFSESLKNICFGLYNTDV